MIDLTTKRPGEVSRVARAVGRRDGDTRQLKEELRADNPYAHAFLAARRLTFYRGAITDNRTAAILEHDRRCPLR
jgi:hypothetical protein